MSSNPPPIADPEDLLGTYAFLPWLRQGMATAITAPNMAPSVPFRALLSLIINSDRSD